MRDLYTYRFGVKKIKTSLWSQQRMNRILYSTVLSLTLAIFVMGCDSGQYSDKANKLIDSIHAILISEKLCSDKNDCRKKQFVFFEGAKGIYISIYGITDPSTTEKIVGACIEDHTSNPAIYYELNMYNLTKDEDLHTSKPKKTILKLVLNK